MNDASSLFYNRYLVTPASRGLRCAFTGHRPQKLPFGFDEEDEPPIQIVRTAKKPKKKDQ